MQRIYRSKVPPGRHVRIDGAGSLDKVIAIDQSPIGRTPRSNPATLHQRLRPRPQALRPHPGVEDAGIHARPVLLQRQRGPLRRLPGRRHHQDRDALPARRVRALRGVQGPPPTTATPSRSTSRAATSPTCWTCLRGRPRVLRQQPAIARHMQTLVDVGWATCAWASPPHPVGRRGPAGEAGQRAGQAAHRPHHVHPRRAHHRPALRGRAQAAGGAGPPGGPGQHRGGDRAQPGRGEDGRLDHRPRSRGRLRRWPPGGRRPARGGGRGAREPHRPLPAQGCSTCPTPPADPSGRWRRGRPRPDPGRPASPGPGLPVVKRSC